MQIADKGLHHLCNPASRGIRGLLFSYCANSLPRPNFQKTVYVQKQKTYRFYWCFRDIFKPELLNKSWDAVPLFRVNTTSLNVAPCNAIGAMYKT